MAGKWRGKGNQAVKAVAQQPQVLELQFHERANSLFELMMNFNTQPQQLDHAWRDVMELRNKCLKAYGAAPARGGMAAVAADGGPAWKSEFYSAYARKHKTVLSKDDISFEIHDVEGSKPGAIQYVATLTCNNLAQTYQGDKPANSKKEAEHLAAKAAIEAEFPHEFERLNGLASGVMPAAGKGQKRKAEVISNAAPQESKSRLTQAVQLMVGTMNKGDIVYETVQEGSQFTATVVLQAHDPSTGYQGLPADSKKAAENAAAEAALSALADQIAQAEEIHAAKKKKKSQENLAAFKAKKAEKDEQKLS